MQKLIDLWLNLSSKQRAFAFNCLGWVFSNAALIVSGDESLKTAIITALAAGGVYLTYLGHQKLEDNQSIPQ